MRLNLNTMRQLVRSSADMVNSDFVSDDEISVWINNEAAELHELLIAADEDYEMVRLSIVVTAGVEDYPLPDNLLRIKKVFDVTSGKRVPIPRYNLDDIDASDSAPRYHPIGDRLSLVPPFNGKVELWYYPMAKMLFDDNDTIEISVVWGWEEFIVQGAAAKCLAKEESDPSLCLGRKEQVRQRIITMRKPRDASGRRTIIDRSGRDI